MIQYGFHDLSQIRANGYGFEGSPFLGTGWTFAIFQHEGNLPVLNEMKNKLRSGLASDEHNFRTLAGIPSGPEDFLISRFASTLFNFPSNMDFRHSAWDPLRKGEWLVRLGKWWIFRKYFSQNIGLFNRVRLAIFYQMRWGRSFRISHRFGKWPEVQELYVPTFVRAETIAALIWRCIYFLSPCVAVDFQELCLISTRWTLALWTWLRQHTSYWARSGFSI